VPLEWSIAGFPARRSVAGHKAGTALVPPAGIGGRRGLFLEFRRLKGCETKPRRG